MNGKKNSKKTSAKVDIELRPLRVANGCYRYNLVRSMVATKVPGRQKGKTCPERAEHWRAPSLPQQPMRHTWAFSMLNPKSLVLSSCCEHCHFGSFLGYPFPVFSVKKKNNWISLDHDQTHCTSQENQS